MNRDGSEPRRLTQRAGRDLHPYFSPDGKTLLYNAQIDGAFDVFAYDLATGTEKRLTMTLQDETCARYASDGRIVLLRNDARSDDVWIVGADGRETNLTATPAVRDGCDGLRTSLLRIFHCVISSSSPPFGGSSRESAPSR